MLLGRNAKLIFLLQFHCSVRRTGKEDVGWFVFLERYIHRLDGVSLGVAVILYFSLSLDNVALSI